MSLHTSAYVLAAEQDMVIMVYGFERKGGITAYATLCLMFTNTYCIIISII
jgi:hypothetical protein